MSHIFNFFPTRNLLPLKPHAELSTTVVGRSVGILADVHDLVVDVFEIQHLSL